jgi:hypothetical protein
VWQLRASVNPLVPKTTFTKLIVLKLEGNVDKLGYNFLQKKIIFKGKV